VAAAGFRVRRIHSEQSIGDKLKRARVRRKISVAEVEEATKIRAKFILALESDSWDQIPSEVYGRGYLERYVDFLKVTKEPIIKQYDRERNLYAKHCRDAQIELSPAPCLPTHRFLLTPRLVVLFCITLGGVAFGGILTSQLRQFTSAPFLELAQPASAQGTDASELVVTSNRLVVSGRTISGAKVTVNGVEAAVGEDGRFSREVTMQKGINAVVIEAVSPNGKKTSEILSVVVK
jgi:cytoskeletal protein RodZ